MEWNSRRGDPAQELARAIQALDVDLIALGTNRSGLLKRAFIGGVTRRLLRVVGCDVQIGRPSGTRVPDAIARCDLTAARSTNTLPPLEIKETIMTTTLQNTPRSQIAGTAMLNIPSVAEALAGVLTDTYRLVLKSHTYHWNVTGPLFFSIHEITEDHYTDMFAAADVLAERIRALGKPALVSLAGLTTAPEGQDPDASLGAEDMVRDLLADHEALAQRMRTLVLSAEAAGDPVTADLATERAAFHEKAAWMLRATAS